MKDDEFASRDLPHRLLMINGLDITAHGAALELQNYPGAMVGHRMLSLQLPSDDCLPEGTEQMPERLRRFGLRVGLMLWLFPHLLRRLRHVDAVLFYGVDLQMLVLTLLAARITRTPVFNEITEHPHVLFAASRYKRLGNFVYESLLLSRFKGMIVISSSLKRYVAEHAPLVPVHIMPPIAEYPVSQQTANVLPGLFTYAGSLSEQKDGVISLVEAFKAVHRVHPSARLRIFGHGPDSQRSMLNAKIDSLGLNDAVQLRPSVARGELMLALAESDVLVHCRPSSKQATYGFPTKLAEYLSCGRPVVTTNTSDLACYLDDHASAFLVPPDDTAAFAQAMLATLADRDMADSVGARGRQVFDTSFRASAVVAKLGAWIGARLRDHAGKR